MDARPIPDASVRVTVQVAPWFFTNPPDLAPGEPGNPELVKGQPQETLHRDVVTDADGRAAANFDADAVYDRLGEAQDPQGQPPFAVVASVSAAARFLDIRYGTRLLAGWVSRDGQLTVVVPADLGSSIVGHTTPSSVRLWFQVPFEPSTNHEFSCNVVTEQVLAQAVPAGRFLPGPTPPGAHALGRTLPVQFENEANTATVEFVGLAADSHHQYSLTVHHRPTGRRFTLVTGSFTTPNAAQPHVSFAFGSCHLPTVDDGPPDQLTAEARRSLNRWQRLVDRRDYEFLMLIGDQIYGDDIEDKWPTATDFERYVRRYRQLWAHWPPREVLRSTPTYMILDDHDVADDFGTGNLDDLKVAAALRAYELFQDVHNPGDPDDGPPYHYSFRWGPAAFFVSEGRTQRGEGTPVLGRRQMADFERWATSADTRDADIIFFVAPVPMALLPTEVIRQIAEELTEEAGAVGGGLIGLGVGWLLGGPLGGAIGAAVFGAVGYELGQEVAEHIIDKNLLSEADLAERWDRRENQPDLVRVLDLLFNLANGVGEPSPRKRAVFILAGDIHAGTMHTIRSLPKGAGTRHRANPLIHQLTSSSISRQPLKSSLYAEAVSHIDEDLDIGLTDLNILTIWDGSKDWESIGSGAIDVDDVFDEGDAEYHLDPNIDRRYLTQFAGLLMERTVGLVVIERLQFPRRVYRVRLRIEGDENRLATAFDLDLDGDHVIARVDNARFVRQSVPSELRPGQRVAVEIMMKNVGVSQWRPPSYGLQLLNSVWHVDRVVVPSRVAENRQVTFRFELQAPHLGQFPLTWVMSRSGRLDAAGRPQGAFGPTTTATIIVRSRAPDECAELRRALDRARQEREAKRNEISQFSEPDVQAPELLQELSIIDERIRGIERLRDALGC